MKISHFFDIFNQSLPELRLLKIILRNELQGRQPRRTWSRWRNYWVLVELLKRDWHLLSISSLEDSPDLRKLNCKLTTGFLLCLPNKRSLATSLLSNLRDCCGLWSGVTARWTSTTDLRISAVLTTGLTASPSTYLSPTWVEGIPPSSYSFLADNCDTNKVWKLLDELIRVLRYTLKSWYIIEN